MYRIFNKKSAREEKGGQAGPSARAPAAAAREDAAPKQEAFSGDEEVALLEAFNLFDKNHDGMITADELGEVMASLGLNPTDDELERVIDKYAINKQGYLDFSEFRALMEKKYDDDNEEEEGRAAFRVFDKDGDGLISREELRNTMEKLGERMTEKELDEMIRAADTDGDGMINYEEFLAKLLGR